MLPKKLKNLKRGKRISWDDSREVINTAFPKDTKRCIETRGFTAGYPEAKNIKTKHGSISFDLPETGEHVLMNLMPGCCVHIANFDRTYDKHKSLGRDIAIGVARARAKPHTGTAIVAKVGPIPKPRTTKQKADDRVRGKEWREKNPDYFAGRKKGRMF